MNLSGFIYSFTFDSTIDPKPANLQSTLADLFFRCTLNTVQIYIAESVIITMSFGKSVFSMSKG